MRNLRKIFYGIALAIGWGWLPVGCVQEEVSPLADQRDVTVQLNVQTHRVSETDGTPAQEEAAVHSLRVYAFVGGQPAGYYYANQIDATPHSFLMDLTLFSTTSQLVDFYVVANEQAMSRPGAELTFTEHTSEDELKNYYFTQLVRGNSAETDLLYGLPMFCQQQVTVDVATDAQTPPTEPGHAGHTQLAQQIAFELQRPLGKLGVFAAKPAGETAELKITGMTLLRSGTRNRNYLMPQGQATLEQVPGTADDISLECVPNAVDKELALDISEAERTNPANYTPVLNRAFYPFENPYGSAQWDQPGDAQGNVLQIDYSFNGNSRQGLVYLPKIDRNHYYTVCCLMQNDGQIKVQFTVADWDKGEDFPLEFDYPTYGRPITPLDPTIQPDPTTNKYPQPTIYYQAGTEEGSYSFSFTITGPVGQTWKPVLYDTEPGDFSITVWQNGQPIRVENDAFPVSQDPYEIRVSASTSSHVGETLALGIGYTPNWDPDGSQLLLINGLSKNLAWEGSEYPELIVIKQIDVPVN